MKRFLLLSFIIFCAGCSRYPTKAPLKRVSEKNDPSSLKLKQGYTTYVKYTHLEDGTNLGIIQMKDDSWSKYWFWSHHITDDMGGTWFVMSDGKKIYMAGYFCCEIILPEKQFENLGELRNFIKGHHGKSP